MWVMPRNSCWPQNQVNRIHVSSSDRFGTCMRNVAKVPSAEITQAYLWPLASALSFYCPEASGLASLSISFFYFPMGIKLGVREIQGVRTQLWGLGPGQRHHVQVFFHDHRSGPSPGLCGLLLVPFFLLGPDWASCSGWGVCSRAFCWPLQV